MMTLGKALTEKEKAKIKETPVDNEKFLLMITKNGIAKKDQTRRIRQYPPFRVDRDHHEKKGEFFGARFPRPAARMRSLW